MGLCEMIFFSHRPSIHPRRGKDNPMKVIHANLGEMNHLTLENTTNTIAQTAPTMVPMMRPLRGARRYCSVTVLLVVVIVVL